MEIEQTIRLAIAYLIGTIEYVAFIAATLVIGTNLIFGMNPWKLFQRRRPCKKNRSKWQ